jgi:DeoR/GlpR family transcriptional regulator of sugar metabolism
MLAVERLQCILNLLHKNKVVLVAELSKEMNVSEETIRRDLEKLEKQDHICRVHGGAYLKEGYGNETTAKVREKLYLHDKERIAVCCMEYINELDSIILDCSTTALNIAKSLVSSNKKVTVITNSLAVVNELSVSSHIRVILLGGELNKNSNAFFGHHTIEDLGSYFADKAFISSAGISIYAGITDYTSEEAMVRIKMMEQAKTRFYVSDITKIGRCAVHVVGDISMIDYLIVSEMLDDHDFLTRMMQEEIKVVVCD